jgi:hypothetical protein
MQAKTQKQVMALQNKAQKVADKLTEEVIFITKGVQHIQVACHLLKRRTHQQQYDKAHHLRWAKKLNKINQLHKQQNSCQK